MEVVEEHRLCLPARPRQAAVEVEGCGVETRDQKGEEKAIVV